MTVAVGTPLCDVVGNDPAVCGAGHSLPVLGLMGYNASVLEGDGGAQSVAAAPKAPAQNFMADFKPV